MPVRKVGARTIVNWVRAVTGLLVLWGSAVWGATLRWDANTESDLAGYRVYQCSQQPCGRAFGTASPLVTLGKVTSLNIGTPAVIQYYFISAYDSANNESSESNVVTVTPVGSPPPSSPPPPSPPPPPPAVPPAPTGLRINSVS
jgi:hypothetical protein